LEDLRGQKNVEFLSAVLPSSTPGAGGFDPSPGNVFSRSAKLGMAKKRAGAAGDLVESAAIAK